MVKATAKPGSRSMVCVVEISVPLKVIAYFKVKPVATSPLNIIPLPVKSTWPATAVTVRVPPNTCVSVSDAVTGKVLSATTLPAESSMFRVG